MPFPTKICQDILEKSLIPGPGKKKVPKKKKKKKKKPGTSFDAGEKKKCSKTDCTCQPEGALTSQIWDNDSIKVYNDKNRF